MIRVFNSLATLETWEMIQDVGAISLMYQFFIIALKCPYMSIKFHLT